MNKEIKTNWLKSLPASARQMLQLAIAKAAQAKTPTSIEQRTALAVALIRKAFSPIINTRKLDNGRKPWQTVTDLIAQEVASNKIPLIAEEVPQTYREIVENVGKQTNNIDKCDPYVYIFVRQDLKPEQQLVQAAHATFVLGKYTALLTTCDHRKTNFVVCGVKDLAELRQRMNYMVSHEIKFEVFVEPDIDNEETAIASYPITSVAKRKKFARFKLLKFEQPTIPSVDRVNLMGPEIYLDGTATSINT